MGYTHYFQFKKPAPIKGNADAAETAYKKAIAECAKIARVYNAECKNAGLDADRLSGFSAHTKPGKYGGLLINGKQENAFEPFCVPEHFRQNFENSDGFGFCKTNRLPYDTVVTACLAVLAYRLGNLIAVSSDGKPDDWSAGVALAQRVTRRKIQNPITKPAKRAA